ncbi:polymorphic transmembrane cluster 2 transmembrane protein 11 [Biomphalaria pfeifferi]|uniref:Polymorphic transmembrane cluster 2 transmembrane protein 11 n=1 Tax=Biomphalaria pfeifferi TaxID=112525 RepID=A0AAD8CAZ9_BIOPF|nr:polymorphic transmembrane cluster 2 transmembrane protein 11 [Biomphalaria pfeifferi]
MEASCIINVVFVLALLLISHGKFTDRGKTIILQKKVSKFMDIDIASSNIDTDNTIEIRCNNITLFVCRKDSVCIKKTKSYIFNVTKTKDEILRVYFENVARINPIYINGTWQVCNAGEYGNRCDDTLTRQVFIYAQLDYFNCTYDFADVDHSLKISCNAVNLFPQALCSFDKMKVFSDIEYTQAKVQGNPSYFNTKCSVTLDINKDSFQVKTTIYPNITGDITDMAYGISVTLSVKNVKKIIPGKRKCFLEGNSTSIHSCICEEILLGGAAFNSSVNRHEIGFYLCPYLDTKYASNPNPNREENIILQENVSKFMDIDIASSNIDTENTIEILCNNIVLYVCRKDSVCIEKIKSNFFNVTKTKDGILRVYFENVARIIPIYINGTWQVCNAGEYGYRCDDTLTRQVFIYAIYGEPECLWDDVKVTCFIHKVYPNAICKFNFTNIDAGDLEGDVLYQHVDIENGMYYNTTCTYWTSPFNENHIATVSIYANGTGIKYGKTTTLYFFAIHGEPECLLEEFTITCFTEKVYPKAMCHFNITYIGPGHIYEYITYQHVRPPNGTYYKTSCTYWSIPAKEKRSVTVTIYPNVTGNITDMQVGKTKTLVLFGFKLIFVRASIAYCSFRFFFRSITFTLSTSPRQIALISIETSIEIEQLQFFVYIDNEEFLLEN